jgi:hypothetical protein
VVTFLFYKQPNCHSIGILARIRAQARGTPSKSLVASKPGDIAGFEAAAGP